MVRRNPAAASTTITKASVGEPSCLLQLPMLAVTAYALPCTSLSMCCIPVRPNTSGMQINTCPCWCMQGPGAHLVGLTWASHGPLRASNRFSRLLMGLYWIVSHGFLVLVFFPWLPRSPFCSGGVWGEGSALSCSNWRFVWLATLFWALVGALNPRDFSFSTSYIVLRPRLKSFPFFVMFS